MIAALTGFPPQGVDDGPQGGRAVDHGRETRISLQRHRRRWQRKSFLQGGQEDGFCSEGSGDDLLMQSGESLTHLLQVIFDKFDKNNDGTVSKEEFVNVLKDDKDIVEVLQKSST